MNQTTAHFCDAVSEWVYVALHYVTVSAVTPVFK